MAPGRVPAAGEETMTADRYNLARFVEAQERDYSRAIDEIRRGRKQSHWMWYVFPQLAGLGASAMSQRYAIRSAAEAAAYLEHPVLGPRLIACADAVLTHAGRPMQDIFGSPDDPKLRSSATLFAAVSPRDSVFQRIIDHCFDGAADQATLRLLGR
jgi:uncharacterized protein (DUF1810 family)